MKKIAVYCGSRMPENPIFKENAVALANYFVDHEITLIYGGASVGIMGVIADSMLSRGGTVIGVMPRVLVEQEVSHKGLSELIVVENMHIRKKTMMDLSDGFIAFPGGCGTMEEIFEVITWNQIGIHQKPYGFLNIDHFYDGIKQYLKMTGETGFIPQEMLDRIIFEDSFSAFIERLIR